ncbi:MAG TPA: MTH938/NDUFAF3 family protein [Burkholderiaceae bacterium]|nr:MTH938/NDUFAF3 family protein [Burkholderiaceae bacterium]
MLLQSESNPTLNTVTAYGQGYVEINAVHYEHAVYFAPDGAVTPLEATCAADFTEALLKKIAGLNESGSDPLAFLDADAAPAKPDNAPEVILVGTGLTQRFLAPDAVRTLTRLGIGVEAMTTQAAARTYNILMAEGRHVVVALLPHEETQQ